MDRKEALQQLNQLINQDLFTLAQQYGVTVWKETERGQRQNKGWAGHVIERFLGLPLNSAQSPNFGSWELKVVPLKYLQSGRLVAKETMAITMIDPVEVMNTPFEESHVYRKLRRAVVVARIDEGRGAQQSLVYNVSSFDLNDAVFEQVKADYEEVQHVLRTRGFDYLTGRMGMLIQPRTKGAGHGSKSRAFYARKSLVEYIVGLRQSPFNE
ncbi:MAG: hypothetical protein D6712_13905 [Chloroflexi bacterium]|nr:MAG: hypothetical protein D6712_13905 [Chloroflexota bacterium]